MKSKWSHMRAKQFNQLDGIRRNWLGMVWEMGKSALEATSLLCIYPDYYTFGDNAALPYFVMVKGTKVQKVTINDIL